MNNKRALVCGASQGIGRATALELAKLGAQVVILARSEDRLFELIKELPGEGHTYIAIDIANLEQLHDEVELQLEERPIEILVNNTGGPKGGPLLEASEDEFVQAFRNHVIVSSNLAQMLLPGMRESGFGRIINVISTSVKAPIPNLGVSNTIRGAVANWAKTLSQEVGQYGITVNNVLPGYTETPRLIALKESASKKLGKTVEEIEEAWKLSVPMRRFAKPEEVAQAIAFLASPAASYISGINLPVDGGRTQSL